MSEAQAPQAPQTSPPVEEDRDYRELLRSLVGKKVTVVNPESYEALPAGGSELKANYYPGKIGGVGRDYLIFHTVLAATKKDRQPVKQFIPLTRIKRLSIMQTGTLLHL